MWSAASSAARRLAVLARLVLFVDRWLGLYLSAVGPRSAEHSPQRLKKLIEEVWDMGFDAVRWLGRYFLLGAALVVPIWLLVRLTPRKWQDGAGRPALRRPFGRKWCYNTICKMKMGDRAFWQNEMPSFL